MSEKLKPCPHCNVELFKCVYNSGRIRWSHEASDCINSRRFVYDAAKWNHRPTEAALIEALEMAMSEINQMKPTEALVAVSLIGRAALKLAKGE